MSLTPRMEKFCQAIVKGMNQSDAYRQAYSTSNMKEATVNNRAYGLMQKGEIKARVKELREKAVEDIKYTINDSFAKLNELQKTALDANNVNAALKAEELKGKLKGLYVERQAFTDTKGQDLPMSVVSSKDLLEIMERRRNDRNRSQKSSD